LHVNETAMRVFAIIGAILIDGLTLILRLITLFPRHLDNRRETLVYKTLMAYGAPVDQYEEVTITLSGPLPRDHLTTLIYFYERPSPLRLI
jgi:hypothetical protein